MATFFPVKSSNKETSFPVGTASVGVREHSDDVMDN